VGTTCYLVNRSPSSALDDKNTHEVWSGKKPSLQNLRVFGCDAYVHVPKENRSKVDNKSEKCIFIGYKYGVKGYKLWNLLSLQETLLGYKLEMPGNELFLEIFS
jgi:hypothetical protein